VGCGTGAITAEIARAVGPGGKVLGVDRDASLLDIARSEHRALANLRFETADATALHLRERFDMVSAARVLQWVGEPAAALQKIKEAAKPGGLVVVLDYNHARNVGRRIRLLHSGASTQLFWTGGRRTDGTTK
jgi:ubiquinone/menaquinone biosynthesis C-methylase UbiE